MLHTVTGLKLVLSKDSFSGHPEVPGLLTDEKRRQMREEYLALKPRIFCKDGRTLKARIKPNDQAEFDRLMSLAQADTAAQNMLRSMLGEKWLQDALGYRVGQKVRYWPCKGFSDPIKAQTVWEGTITGATAPNAPYGGSVDLLFPGCGIGGGDFKTSFQEGILLTSLASGAMEIEQ